MNNERRQRVSTTQRRHARNLDNPKSRNLHSLSKDDYALKHYLLPFRAHKLLYEIKLSHKNRTPRYPLHPLKYCFTI